MSRSPRSRPSVGPSPAALVGIVGLLVLAVATAYLVAEVEDAEEGAAAAEPAPPEREPFASVPDEEPPPRREGGAPDRPRPAQPEAIAPEAGAPAEGSLAARVETWVHARSPVLVADDLIAALGLEKYDGEQLWRKAKELAAAAAYRDAQALDAKRENNHADFVEAGKLAQRLYDTALEITAVHEEELLLTEGEDDPKVRTLVATRSAWFQKNRYFHKFLPQ